MFSTAIPAAASYLPPFKTRAVRHMPKGMMSSTAVPSIAKMCSRRHLAECASPAPILPVNEKAPGLYETRGKQRQSRFAPGDHQSRVTHLCSHCVSKATPACNCYRIGLVFVETLGPATFRRLLTEKRVRKETKRYACQGSNRYPAPLTACKGSASPEFSMHFLRRR